MPLHFKGLELQENGMYDEQDFMNLLKDSIAAYDRILETYALADAA